MVKAINKLRKPAKEVAEEIVEEVPSKEEKLLTEIRDILKSK